MSMAKIKRNDEVIVITGKSKGVRGKVLRIYTDNRVLVEGANLVKKHQKPNPQKGIEGGIVEKEAPIHISNVAIFNSVTKKADKVSFKLLNDGRKVRSYKSNQEVIDAI